VPHAVFHLIPPGLVEERGGGLEILVIARHVVTVHPVERVDAGVRHRLAPLEQLLAQRLAIEAHDQRPAHPHVR
jgi:hypothetical protein